MWLPALKISHSIAFSGNALFQLLGDGKAFVEFVVAFLLSLGFQLAIRRVGAAAGACPAYTEEASAAAWTEAYGVFPRAASQPEPSHRVKGARTEGFDSTTKSRRTLLPGGRLGTCLRHAIHKLPGQLAAIPSPVCKALRTQCHTLLYRARQRKG
jgi:hypothetical protein